MRFMKVSDQSISENNQTRPTFQQFFCQSVPTGLALVPKFCPFSISKQHGICVYSIVSIFHARMSEGNFYRAYMNFDVFQLPSTYLQISSMEDGAWTEGDIV